MTLEEDMRWFKQQFVDNIQASIRGTPFTSDLLTAIAIQETGYIWRRLYKEMPVTEVLKFCVGDTIDSPNRSAFPINKSKLLAVSNGDRMFAIAREALELMAQHISDYQGAVTNADKFCHGFGIFQYDLQFFRENPNFFLDKRWYHFDECLKLCVNELKNALTRTYGRGKTDLTDEEMVYVAIAYNRGTVVFSKRFKQGYFDGNKYYGEYIWEYLQISKTITVRARSNRIKWFELFFSEEGGRAYPIAAGMDGDKCIELFHLKSRSISELEGIFKNASLATEFVVASKNKVIPTPIIED